MFAGHIDPTDLSEIGFTPAHDTRVQFFEDLGLEIADVVVEASEGTDSFSESVSTEQIDVFDEVDIIVGYGDEEGDAAGAAAGGRAGLRIPAIERRSTVFFAGSTPLAPPPTRRRSPSSTYWPTTSSCSPKRPLSSIDHRVDPCRPGRRTLSRRPTRRAGVGRDRGAGGRGCHGGVALARLAQRELGDVWAAVGGRVDTYEQAAVTSAIPRTVLAVAAGATLGVSGAVMQGVTRNPLADPGILGVNLGATLAVAIGVAYFGLVEPSSYVSLRPSPGRRDRPCSSTSSARWAGAGRPR